MKVQTSRFGEVDVDESSIIRLPEGLMGFPELTQYVLFQHDQEPQLNWLQSINDGSVAFAITSPLTFKPDYTVEATKEEVQSLSLEDQDDAIVCVIVDIPTDPKKMSANLKAPLIFNPNNRVGKQLIVKDPQYHTAHFITDTNQAATEHNK